MKKRKRTPYNTMLYSVWNNRTDEVVIIDGTSKQAAEAMGVKFNSFYTIVSKVKSGSYTKWHIEERSIFGGNR